MPFRFSMQYVFIDFQWSYRRKMCSLVNVIFVEHAAKRTGEQSLIWLQCHSHRFLETNKNFLKQCSVVADVFSMIKRAFVVCIFVRQLFTFKLIIYNYSKFKLLIHVL